MYNHIGQSYQHIFETHSHHSAHHYGNEGVHVLATVALIAFIEQCCGLFLRSILPQNEISVGTLVNIKHRAPAKIGTSVRVSCQLTSIQETKVLFAVHVFDGTRLLMEGFHGRAIIHRDIFSSTSKEQTDSTDT